MSATPAKATAGGQRVVGVTIDETDQPLQTLFDEIRDVGIDTVFVGEDLASSGGFRVLSERNDMDLFINIRKLDAEGNANPLSADNRPEWTPGCFCGQQRVL